MQENERLQLVYLLGKMDGLRYPVGRVNLGGSDCLAYSKDYIEELLKQRAKWVTSKAESAGMGKTCTT